VLKMPKRLNSAITVALPWQRLPLRRVNARSAVFKTESVPNSVQSAETNCHKNNNIAGDITLNNNSHQNDEDNRDASLAKAGYEGYLESPRLTGDVKITVGKDALLLAATFDRVAVEYDDIIEFKLSDYTVHIVTAEQSFAISRLGHADEWFYYELYAAYNRKVLAALFVQGEKILETAGDYLFSEYGNRLQGRAKMLLYQDCLCILPSDSDARRIPYSFISDIKREQYSIEIVLNPCESCIISKLGYDTDAVFKYLTDRITSLQEKRLAFIRDLDPSIGMSEAVEAARLMPADQAASFAKLEAGYPSLAGAIRNVIKSSRIAGSFETLQNICDSRQMLVGIKEGKSVKAESEQEDESSSNTSEETSQPVEQEEQKPEYTVWIIALGQDHKAAVVELALPGEQAAATYLYRTEGNFDELASIINRALESVSFRREFIMLAEAKLQSEKYAEYRMLLERTPVLKLLRERYLTRVIHASPEKWKADIIAALKLPAYDVIKPPENNSPKYCASCGACLQVGVKYCSGCGSKII
jgi:hypothetical protein